MSSAYYKAHQKELEKIRDYYEKSPNRELQYRARCITELLRWEAMKK